MTLLAVSLLALAEMTVYVYKKDGTKVSYIASNVDSIGFVDIDSKGYEYVDLGLPSGLLWAKCNLGADISTESGRNFAWGDVIPNRGGSTSSYIWYKNNKYTKYNDTDKKKVLDLEDDAANVYMGGNWRLPTSVEFAELISNCEISSGRDGKSISFRSKINGKSITFPTVLPNGAGLYGYYFLWLGEISKVASLSVYSEGSGWYSMGYVTVATKDRYNLYSIRPVLPRSNSYVISFSANGGEGSIAMNANHGDNLTLPTNTFIRDGYEFICWIDEDGKAYPEGETIVVLNEKRFYAQWIKIPTEVETNEGFIDLGLPSGTKWAICDAGASSPEKAGTISTSSQGRTPSVDEVKELISNCTKTSIVINGVQCYLFTSKVNGSTIILRSAYYWSRTYNGVTAYYWDHSGYTMTATSTAKYPTRPVKQSDKLILTFDANSGSGTMEKIEEYQNNVISIPKSTFVRDGYYFSGWNTEADGTGTYYADMSDVSLKSNMTLYAQWRPAEVSGIENGYEWIDLGLPSGTKWATMNVGADSPEDYGDYFAWGETVSKSTYSNSDYKWYINGSSSNIKKYNYSYSTGMLRDSIYVLEKEDDVAFINWGGDWRMPTLAEQLELSDTSYTTWNWTTQNGVNGYKVTSKINGNSIFLPASGYRYGSGLNYAGSDGYYWSSSLRTDSSNYAYCLSFGSSYVGISSYYTRNYGLSVRPVLAK